MVTGDRIGVGTACTERDCNRKIDEFGEREQSGRADDQG